MPEQDNIRNVWSEDELERALAVLRPAEDGDERVFARTKADLLAAAGTPEPTPRTAPAPHRRRRWGWAAAVGTVAAVVTGILVVQTAQPNGHLPSAAAEQLNAAAEKLDTVDEPLAPGEYRYVATHAWWLSAVVAEDEQYAFLTEQLVEVWVPADDSQEWLDRSRETGAYKWVSGDEEAAKEAGLLPRPGKPVSGSRPLCDGGECGWQNPSHEFLASLPRDATALYDRLRADTRGKGNDPDLEMVVYVADVLRSGMVPADLRAALYRALALVPTLEITEEVANLDGAKGTAYGVSAHGQRHDVIIDPRTGEFIGEREVTEDGNSLVPPNTVTSYTSVTTGVAPKIGVLPN
ncbi:CU044_5270 family protein [Actinophytocola sp. NPDC049390]|uniref:CU044_5270 family protein n=1 Tax=Actinophytocola sp. NPDC049390 TaxID=3363894 RepID=UPI0037ACE768